MTLALLAPLAYLWLLWALYVLVMGLYRAHLDKRLGRTARVLGAPFLIVGWAMDVACNVTFAALLFLEPPRELLVTTRLKRHMKGSGWRRSVARWICSKLLDPFDPSGSHCEG